MAGIQGTNVVAPIVPLDTADVHPTHAAAYGLGGYRTAATNADRDAIPTPRREEGMLVFVAATGKVWRLGSDLTTWTEQTSVSAWSDITGKPSTFSPSAHASTHGSGGADPITVAQSQVTGLTSDLAAKAPADTPTFTGLVTFTDISTATSSTINGDTHYVTTIAFADATFQSSAFTSTLKTKLAGIASNATANATDAQLRDRSTHTGTQAAGTITGLAASATTDTTSATNITSGTLPAARLPATAVTAGAYGSASSVATFTVDAEGRLTAAGSTAISVAASAIASGTIATARLASGTASSSTFLRGDQTWATAGSTSASDLTSGTLPEARLPNLVILHPFLLAGM